jgi:cupin 2 domain-containing protein
MIDTSGNLLRALPRDGGEEIVTPLVSSPALRIERIVSTGQASPPGFWYEQDWTEWVLLICGAAELRIDGEAAPRRLAAGDYLLLPPRLRHRVEWTQAEPPTVWLAVHWYEDASR